MFGTQPFQGIRSPRVTNIWYPMDHLISAADQALAPPLTKPNPYPWPATLHSHFANPICSHPQARNNLKFHKAYKIMGINKPLKQSGGPSLKEDDEEEEEDLGEAENEEGLQEDDEDR